MIIAADGTVDAEATIARREELDRDRRRKTESGIAEAGVPCPACGKNEGVTRSRHPMRRAGPWIARRYDGDGPNFELQESHCLACGALVDVSEVLKQSKAADV